MPTWSCHTGRIVFLSILSSILLTCVAFGQQEKILYNFAIPGTFGGGPFAGLISDSAGNFYGTSIEGGAFGDGSIFEMSPRSGGGFITKTLHNFNSQNGTDGALPYSTLLMDASGNLYGTTEFGGSFSQGTAFELIHQAAGGWIVKILHNFNSNNGDGYQSFAALIFDHAGNLYGTTAGGGANAGGIVFELTPQKSGTWNETILHNFCSQPSCADGATPYSALIFDQTGNLYGTTFYGGIHNNGTVFELSPESGGTWNETVLHNFNNHIFSNTGSDGFDPVSALIFDAKGNLYGTTTEGGAYREGTVFQLTPQTGGGWKETPLHSFQDDGVDGTEPGSSLVFDAAGNLYGTTESGGATLNGTVYELSESGGAWNEQILLSFNGSDGAEPFAVPFVDAAGNLYGTTYQGGASNNGLIYEITH